LQNHLDDKKMKLNYKNQKNKIFSLLLMLVGIVSLGFFMQGCTEDALDNTCNDMSINAKYLDLDVASTTAFTKTELDLMANAVQRITDHLVFDKENNKYVFGLKSPAEINVSERLFNYIYSGMGVYTKNTMPRLKSESVECTTIWGIGYYQTTCALTDAQTKELLQTVKKYLSGIGGAAQIATIIEAFKTTPYATAITAIVGTYTYLETSHVDSIYDRYVNSNQTGSTYTNTTFTASIVPYTTYQFTFK